jgi:hypothetical protein
MTNDEARTLIERLRAEALAPYPLPSGSDVDPRFALALGLIAGTATEALAAEREGRPMQLKLKEAGTWLDRN